MLVLFVGQAAASPDEYFGIHVVDDATGRGIPLVYLQTTYKTTYLTDSNGYVAFQEPGLMDGDVWFDVKSYGYESPQGLFGVEGVQLHPKAGGLAEIRLKRTQIAERLYRITGYGIDRDSALLGKAPPTTRPLLSARVTGQDSVQTAVYRGKMYWFWGDTDQIGFGLGCYHSTGAVSPLPAALDPDRGIELDYFVDRPGGFARGMVDITDQGSRPIWIDALTVVDDAAGQSHLVARYAAVNKQMVAEDEGLVAFNDSRQVFQRLVRFDRKSLPHAKPSGHPIRIRDGGQWYLLYCNGVRVKADFASVSDPAAYEALTCLDAGGNVVRDSTGKVTWRWQRDAQPVDATTANALIHAGKLKSDESPLQLVDADTHEPIRLANGSIAWNAYLHRWTFLFGQREGASFLGEIWLATARSPLGPWREARKVATHAIKQNNNDFYNPIQHDQFQGVGGRYLYFEGTFVNTFSGNPAPTPYYDYNNIMYRVDLADPRLKWPEPPAGLVDVVSAD